MVNKRVKEFRSFISIPERGKSIYTVRNNSQLKKEILCLSLFSGAMIDWWAQVSAFVLVDLLTPEEYSLWMEHLLFDQILSKHSFSKTDLDTLSNLIEKWGNNFKEQLATRPLDPKEICPESTLEDIQLLKAGFSPYYLKFESLLHWPR